MGFRDLVTLPKMATDLGLPLMASHQFPCLSRSGGTETNRSLALRSICRPTPPHALRTEVGCRRWVMRHQACVWRLS